MPQICLSGSLYTGCFLVMNENFIVLVSGNKSNGRLQKVII